VRASAVDVAPPNPALPARRARPGGRGELFREIAIGQNINTIDASILAI